MQFLYTIEDQVRPADSDAVTRLSDTGYIEHNGIYVNGASYGLTWKVSTDSLPQIPVKATVCARIDDKALNFYTGQVTNFGGSNFILENGTQYLEVDKQWTEQVQTGSHMVPSYNADGTADEYEVPNYEDVPHESISYQLYASQVPFEPFPLPKTLSIGQSIPITVSDQGTDAHPMAAAWVISNIHTNKGSTYVDGSVTGANEHVKSVKGTLQLCADTGVITSCKLTYDYADSPMGDINASQWITQVNFRAVTPEEYDKVAAQDSTERLARDAYSEAESMSLLGADYTAMEPFYRRAVELAPDNVTYFSGLCKNLVFEHKTAEIEPLARKCIKLVPDSAEPLFWLSVSLAEQKRFTEAEPFIRKACALVPDNTNYQRALASITKSLKQ